jgi:hypothetical protein
MLKPLLTAMTTELHTQVRYMLLTHQLLEQQVQTLMGLPQAIFGFGRGDINARSTH